jgi:hypothetical protein
MTLADDHIIASMSHTFAPAITALERRREANHRAFHCGWTDGAGEFHPPRTDLNCSYCVEAAAGV